jgi:hypothetical protein
MRQWFCVCGCLLLVTSASAQTIVPTESRVEQSGMIAQQLSADHGQAHEPAQQPFGDIERGPTLALRGFTDINFSATDNPNASDGFSVGQFVLHLSSSLGGKVSFFAETSFTAQPDGYSLVVERSILRYDYNDHFKISVGKYHTPINYWNTAFHHGFWLQTTASRPEMIQVGGAFEPVHFVGVLAEGSLSSPTIGLGYNVGLGNGRGATLSGAGDAGGAVNGKRAWVGKLFARPARFYGLEVGTAFYHDRIAVPNRSEFNELISSAYVAWSHGAPEVLAEFANVHHHDRTTSVDFDSRAFYVQVAYRIPDQSRWKSYSRFEKITTADGAPFGLLTDTLWTFGTRYDPSPFVALKLEYRRQERPSQPRVNGVFAQTAFTF